MTDANAATSIEIVPGSPSHWPALARIIRRDLSMEPGQISYYLRHYMPGTAVALVDGRTAGCYVFYEVPRPQVAWLGIIVVDGAFQSCGVGRRLVEHLERRAAADGFSAIEMSVDPDNAGAQRFYERHGYNRLDRPGDRLTYAKSITPTAPRQTGNALARFIHWLKCRTIWRLRYALTIGNNLD
ncbi:GNAT family N-acetyltransferase [bacterium]|nr:GNAT family N-acetyltransferase [bacterium]